MDNVPLSRFRLCMYGDAATGGETLWKRDAYEPFMCKASIGFPGKWGREDDIPKARGRMMLCL